MFACGGGTGTPGAKSATPTEAYKNLFAAVKANDLEAIKQHLSKKTHDLAKLQASRSGTPIEAVYSNGFTETTFASGLPTIRDERVSGTMGALEVWNSQKSTWEDLPFILEDGSWKLAVGDIFSGGYKSPGPGRDEIEKQAANAVRGNTLPTPHANSAANTAPKVIEVKPMEATPKK
jgi:hypothetical protein